METSSPPSSAASRNAFSRDAFKSRKWAVRNAARRAAREREACQIVRRPGEGYVVLTTSEWKRARKAAASGKAVPWGYVHPCGALEVFEETAPRTAAPAP